MIRIEFIKNKILYYLKMIRIHQSVKNLLIFTPLLASHHLPALTNIGFACIGFLSFSLLSSTVYIINDLHDLELDRKHEVKRNRPLASGNISTTTALLSIPLLLSLSLFLASFLDFDFVCCLTVYFVATLLYSFVIKKIVIVDCIVLSVLYTLRIISGIIAIHGSFSLWLMTFSLFFFLSLAFIKRYAEIYNLKKTDNNVIPGRGYHVDDLYFVGNIAIASGFVSIVLFSLYLKDPSVQEMLNNIYLTFCSLPILIYWISYMFLKVFRGEMGEDPVVFAIKDFNSLMSGFLFIIVFFLGGII